MSATSMEKPQCSLPKNHEGDHLPETDNITHKCIGMYCMWCDSQCKYELVTFQTWHGEDIDIEGFETMIDDMIKNKVGSMIIHKEKSYIKITIEELKY